MLGPWLIFVDLLADQEFFISPVCRDLVFNHFRR